MRLSGWGRFPVLEAQVSHPRDAAEVIAAAQAGQAIARGNGRAYGDCAISPRNTLQMKHLNRMVSFDQTTGQLVAEAGVLLADVIDTFLPRGWFPLVTPGTKYVTLGGMIAADVHGKNHHKDGSFGACVDWIDLVDATGTVQRCTPTENADLFAWTVGGMGLTGVILRAAIRLRPVQSAFIRQKTLVADNIDHAIEIFEASMAATYSVAWIDCVQGGQGLGRSLVMLGEHAQADDLPRADRAQPLRLRPRRKLRMPLDLPGFAINRFSVGAFNALYYWNGRRKPQDQLVYWDSYFYPLDAILDWNRIYGRKGFAQYQCVIPLAQANAGMKELLAAISEAGSGSFLAVLKRFGAQDSRFSFPMEGYTLSLDFPVTQKTLALMDRLDQITLAHGGRYYLAKDSRMSRDVFHQSDPRAQAFRDYLRGHGETPVFTSAQSERLGL